MNLTGTTTINTSRLVLRRIEISDAHNMYKNWASNPNVTKYLSWNPHENEDMTLQVIKFWMEKYHQYDYFHWAIELKEIGEIIGTISVVHLDLNTNNASIGYCIGETFWNRGYTSEALQSVMNFLFQTVGVTSITACHDIRNPYSGKVMEKNHMHFVNETVRTMNEKLFTLKNYLVTKEEWENLCD